MFAPAPRGVWLTLNAVTSYLWLKSSIRRGWFRLRRVRVQPKVFSGVSRRLVRLCELWVLVRCREQGRYVRLVFDVTYFVEA